MIVGLKGGFHAISQGMQPLLRRILGQTMQKIVLSVFITWTFVNTLKPIITWIRTGKINRRTIFTIGGMPSGHTSLVASLATALYLGTGFSPIFVTALVLTLIVIYDAITVRIIIEKQSKIINMLIKDKDDFPELEDDVGHTPAEVLVSVLLSIVIPVIIYSVL